MDELTTAQAGRAVAEWERLRDYSLRTVLRRRRASEAPAQPTPAPAPPPPLRQPAAAAASAAPKRPASAALEHSNLFRKRTRSAPVPSVAEAEGQEDTADADDALLAEIDLPGDTLSAVHYLRKQFPASLLPSLCPRIVLTQQLYSVIPRRTDVDRTLEAARASRQLLKFKLPSLKPEFYVLLREDYDKAVADATAGLERTQLANDVRPDVFARLQRFLLETPRDVFVEKTQILSEFSEAEIKALVGSGFLTLKDGRSLWFAFPNIGNFMGNLVEGRKEVIGILKRRKYHEMLEKQLTRKPLRQSVLGWPYHLADLLGQELIQTAHTSEGTVVRLTVATKSKNTTV